jgi:hypothetical protein
LVATALGCRFLIRVIQNDIAIAKARTGPNDNSGTAGVDGSVGVVLGAAVGVEASVGEEVTELDEGAGVGDEFGDAEFDEAIFTNALNASFWFPLLLKRPKLESALTI